MTMQKTPVRVNDGARTEFEHVHEKVSDLVLITRQNGEFRRNYGPWLGAFLYLRSMNAARPRSVLWSGLFALGTALVGLWLKYGWPFT
jgi:hypothetical protein